MAAAARIDVSGAMARVGDAKGVNMLRGIAERRRPAAIKGVTVRIPVGTGDEKSPKRNMYVTVNVDADFLPFEVFLRIGDSDPVEQGHLDALARVISHLLRVGGALGEVAQDLRGISAYPVVGDGGFIRSAEDGMSRVFQDVIDGKYDGLFRRGVGYYQEPLPIGEEPEMDAAPNWLQCPHCNGRMARLDGCLSCFECGWSKC